MKSLIELQSIDLLIDAAFKEISSLKFQIQDNSRLDLFRDKIDKINKVVYLLNEQINKHNIHIESNNNKVLNLETRLYGGDIKNNKESEATLAEIDSFKFQTKDLEDKSLEYIIKLEPIEKELVALTLSYEDEQKQTNNTRLTLHRDLEELKKKYIVLQNDKKNVVELVDKFYLEKYFLIRKRKSNAVGTTDKGICTVCSVKLPTGELNSLKGSDDIFYCKTCGAILFFVS